MVKIVVVLALLLSLVAAEVSAQDPGDVAVLRISIEPRDAGEILIDGEAFCGVFANTWAPGRTWDPIYGTPPCTLYRQPGWSGVITARSLDTGREFTGFQAVSYHSPQTEPRPALADSQWSGPGTPHLQFEVSVPSEPVGLAMGPVYIDMRATFRCIGETDPLAGIHFPCGATLPFPIP